MFPYIIIGSFKIPTFTIMVTLGVAASLLVFFMLSKKNKVPSKERDNLFFLFPVIILGGLFFAAVYDKIAHWGESPWYQPAGIAFAGGLVGAAALTLLLYPVLIKKENRNITLHTDILITCVLIAHAIGRIGCFLAGCCYGQETESFLGVVFPDYSLATKQYGHLVKVLPTQLFEAAFLILLFLVLYFFVKKYKLPIYLISYGIFRFFIEFFRGDNRGYISDILSPSQILSILIFVFGIVSIFIYKKIKKKEKTSDIKET